MYYIHAYVHRTPSVHMCCTDKIMYTYMYWSVRMCQRSVCPHKIHTQAICVCTLELCALTKYTHTHMHTHHTQVTVPVYVPVYLVRSQNTHIHASTSHTSYPVAF